MNPILDKFCQNYQQFDQQLINNLPLLYNEKIRFCDPVHCIEGLDQLTHYFEQQRQNVTSCQFEILQVIEQDNRASLLWNMHLQHPRLNRGRPNSVSGSSYLEFDQEIHFHQDYFDLGSMLYEQLPLLGGLIRRIKSRLT